LKTLAGRTAVTPKRTMQHPSLAPSAVLRAEIAQLAERSEASVPVAHHHHHE